MDTGCEPYEHLNISTAEIIKRITLKQEQTNRRVKNIHRESEEWLLGNAKFEQAESQKRGNKKRVN